MNGLMLFCELLATWTIVGARETAPNWMHVDYLDHNLKPDFILIDKATYLSCSPKSELQ